MDTSNFENISLNGKRRLCRPNKAPRGGKLREAALCFHAIHSCISSTYNSVAQGRGFLEIRGICSGQVLTSALDSKS
jgi:hypothetical protein